MKKYFKTICQSLLPLYPDGKEINKLWWNKVIKIIFLVINTIFMLVLIFFTFIYSVEDRAFSYPIWLEFIFAIEIVLLTILAIHMPSVLYRSLIFLLRKIFPKKEIFIVNELSKRDWIKFLSLIIVVLFLASVLSTQQTQSVVASSVFRVTDHEYQRSASKVDGKIKVWESKYYIQDEEIEAEGSWVSQEDKLVPIIQEVRINCVKDRGTCEFITVDVSDTGFLSIFQEEEHIDKWDKDEITTVPTKTGSGCVEYFYRFDRRNYQVTSTRRTLSQTGVCESLEQGSIIMTLGNGWERYNAFYNN